ncbi:Apoptosis-Stimulating Of P53 Protein 2, partial [Manis pentadactyla]
ITPTFWYHHCPVFGQPPGQDEQAGTDGTHFGDPQESPFSVVCGLPATLQAEATFRLPPKEATVFALGPEPPSTPVRLRTRSPLSQSRSPPTPNCPTLLFKRDTQAAFLAPESQLPVPNPVG